MPRAFWPGAPTYVPTYVSCKEIARWPDNDGRMAATARPSSAVWRAVLPTIVCVLAVAAGGWQIAVQAAARHHTLTLRSAGVTYTITHVEQVTGLTDADLGGMSHGIQGLVGVDKMLILVSLTVSAGDSATTYDPQTLTAVSTRSPAVIPPVGGSLTGGPLRAHSHIDGSLSYVVPRDGARITLRIGNSLKTVPLVQTDDAPAGADVHQH